LPSDGGGKGDEEGRYEECYRRTNQTLDVRRENCHFCPRILWRKTNNGKRL